jgi:hypothetical protein
LVAVVTAAQRLHL